MGRIYYGRIRICLSLPDEVGKVDAGGGDVVGVHVVTHITVVLVWLEGRNKLSCIAVKLE